MTWCCFLETTLISPKKIVLVFLCMYLCMSNKRNDSMTCPWRFPDGRLNNGHTHNSFCFNLLAFILFFHNPSIMSSCLENSPSLERWSVRPLHDGDLVQWTSIYASRMHQYLSLLESSIRKVDYCWRFIFHRTRTSCQTLSIFCSMLYHTAPEFTFLR